MIRESYSLGLIFSAVLTFAALLFCVRLYLRFVNRRNKKNSIVKPDWMDEERFEKFRAKKGGK